MKVRGVDDVALQAEIRARGLALSLLEIRQIAERLGRDPSIVECHAFDAQWSEHCSYKSSRHFLKRLPTEGPTVMQGPQEDAGIVHLGEWQGERYGIVIAHESHNHPSQVVPFEGAATGVGGIVRDVLCMGARVIALADPLRFGPLEDPHSRYVAQGVVDGIAAYGNAIGVPNIAGDVYFHEGFRDNCLVNVVALGLIKESEIIHSVAPAGSAGWDIVLVGKATDRSGFGGAAFSSLVLDEADAESNKSAVQVPDPFLKNVIMRASYHAFEAIRELGLTVGFKDLGAGGIMGCTAELAASGGFGARIDLDTCPTTQPDLPAAVIAVGETQERLAWVVPPSFTPRLLEIYNEEFSLPMIARGAQAAVIGTVTTEKEYVLTRRGVEVMRVPIDFLAGGIRYDRPYDLPKPRLGFPTHGTSLIKDAFRQARGEDRELKVMRVETRAEEISPDELEAEVIRETPLVSSLFERDLAFRVLAHGDVCSRRPIYERFDSVVRGTTSMQCGYADAGVVVPIPGSPLGVALSVDHNPRYAEVNPELAAEHAVCEAVRNVVAVGARPAGLTDCLNFGNPENPADFGAFVASLDGIARAARELSVPFVSGNVSLYNQSAAGHSIPPSAIIACVGSIADVSRTVTPGFKRVGSAIYYIGRLGRAIGGSVLAALGGRDPRILPKIDYEEVRRQNAIVLDGIASGTILAVHDVSDGGIFVAAAEMAFATQAGARIGAALFRGEEDPFEPCAPAYETAFFGEHGGFLVEATTDFKNVLRSHGDIFEYAIVMYGYTTAEYELSTNGLEGDPRARIETYSVDELYEAWSAPLRNFYEELPQ